jgi:mycothiol synthase
VSKSAGLDITVAADLAPQTRDEILTVARAATHVDGSFPLDDQVLFDLESTGLHTHRHLVARRTGDAEVIGYAHLDMRSPDTASAHLVIHPAHRGCGLGAALVSRLVDVATTSSAGSDSRLRAWSHGNHPAAAALAQTLGWYRVRDLFQMRLTLDTPIADPAYPPGIEVRPFVPGRDDDAWVEVNAAAFSHHPEQGRLTLDDLRQRERQPWFDPAGIFLAVRGDEVIGSHWTKVHVDDDGIPEIGEVYVIGIDPKEQGSGIGKALTLTGLRYLRDRGLDVMLYVDADNQAAVAVYERVGFTVSRVDVMYERRPSTAGGL